MIPHLSLITVAELSGIFAFAGFVQGFSGFAYGLISLPLLSLVFPPIFAVGIVSVSGIIIIGYNALLHRRYLRFRPVLPLVAIAALFVPIGAFFIAEIPESIVSVGIGCLVILLAGLDLLSAERQPAIFRYRWMAILLSSVAGLLGGAFSTPGPAVIAYLYGRESSRIVAKAEIQLFFFLITLFVIAAQTVRGTIERGNAVLALLFVPLVLLAVTAGARLSFVVPPRRYRAVTSAMLVLLGTVLLVRSLLALTVGQS